MVRILDAMVMKVVKYGSEAGVLRKADEDLLVVFIDIADGLFWLPGSLTVFQTVVQTAGFKKSLFNPAF